jgi:alkylglycerol monooxygenase
MNAIAIALSVPVFFAAIGVEYGLARWLGRSYYRLTDAISSLSCGVVQQATAIFLKLLVLGGYAALTTHSLAAYHVIPAWFTRDSVLAWLVLMVLVDHQYYWFHRASHRVNIFWATHVVHHQSEEYNLSTALRQSAGQALVSAIFYAPLALLGVPTEMFIIAITANTLYQFWIHTRLLGKLGPLEWVLNTPSHHRVHHAIDPRYVDKNYGGITIVWDRLYGTFEEETTEPSYGTVKVLNSFNPLWANLEGWVHIGKLMREATTLRERCWAPFAPPEWAPQSLGGPVVIPPVDPRRVLYDCPTSTALRLYVAGQFAVVGGLLVIQLLSSDEHTAWELAPLAGWICLSTVAWGALFEKKRWAFPLEVLRLLVLPLVLWLPFLSWQHPEDLLALFGGALSASGLVAVAAAVASLSVVLAYLALRAPSPPLELGSP